MNETEAKQQEPAPWTQFQLSDDQIDDVKAWVDGRCPGMTCAACGESHWELSRSLSRAVMATGLSSFHHAPFFVYAIFTCENCAATRLFNANTIGVFPPKGNLDEQ